MRDLRGIFSLAHLVSRVCALCFVYFRAKRIVFLDASRLLTRGRTRRASPLGKTRSKNGRLARRSARPLAGRGGVCRTRSVTRDTLSQVSSHTNGPRRPAAGGRDTRETRPMGSVFITFSIKLIARPHPTTAPLCVEKQRMHRRSGSTCVLID